MRHRPEIAMQGPGTRHPAAVLVISVMAIFVMVIFGWAQAMGGEVKVIANRSVKADVISAGDLKRVFMEERIALGDGTHVEPVLEKDGPVHEAFLRECLGGTDDDLQNYYRALVFSGRGSMPKELGSDEEVVAYVEKTRGAIGYVSARTNAAGVKTLIIGDESNHGERKLIRRAEPNYPETLKQLGIGGTVRLRVTISAKGNVENVELLGGNPILGESAVNAVKQWVYTAGHSRSVLEINVPFDSQR
jgi:TonB family protein